MKKLKCLLFALVPIISVIFIQTVAAFFTIGLSGLINLYRHLWFGGGSLFDELIELWQNTDFNAMLMIVYSLITICAFGFWYQIKCEGNLHYDLRQTFNRQLVAGTALLVPGAQFVSLFIVSIIGALVPSWLEQYSKLMETAGFDSHISFVMLVYSVLLAPICEELIFRGVTMKILKKSFPFWFANIGQAILFGIFHLNWVQGIYAFVLGMMLGYICEKGNSIYVSILFHMLFNFWGTVLPEIIPSGDSFGSVYLMLIIVVVSLTSGMNLFKKGTTR